MIYVKFKPPKLISEFIKLLYNCHTDVYGPKRAKAQKTYKNPECTELQCRDNSFRSFYDLLEIINTYYPYCTAEKLFRILFKVKLYYKENKDQRMYFRMWHCEQMQKIRITFTEEGPFAQKKDFYDSKKGKDNYNWPDLLLTLNINNKEELEEFRKQNNW